MNLADVSADSSYGTLMETGYPAAIATLVCFANGEASLYFSNGGGIIGAGRHAEVASAAKQFVTLSTQFLLKMDAASEFPTPSVGHTTFYVLTQHGRFGFSAMEADLGKGMSPLSALFHSGHRVIAAIRMHASQ